jgi:hypothetical protein
MTSAIREAVLLSLASMLLATATYAREPDFTEMDRRGNRDGYLDLREIPARDLTIVARYADLVGLDIAKPLPIDKLRQGHAIYVRQVEGQDGRGRIKPTPAGDHGFGAIEGKTGARGFGNVGDMHAAITAEDRKWAISQFTGYEYDANRDGLLSREEVRKRNPNAVKLWFRGDVNGDGLLNPTELAYYYASLRVRRMIAAAHAKSAWNVDGVEVLPRHRQHADSLMRSLDKDRNGIIDRDEVPDSWRHGNGLGWADGNGDGQVTLSEMQRGAVRFLAENEQLEQRNEQVEMKASLALAADITRRYDRNRGSALDRDELRYLDRNVAAADLNGNGLVMQDELRKWLFELVKSQKASDDLPLWFFESDMDLDGQVELVEYLRTQPAGTPGRFRNYDHNDDGIVTARESVARAGDKTRYTSNSPRVIEAGKEAYSEVFIPDKLTIADVDVLLTIAKNGDTDIELHLIGPDGTAAALYFDRNNRPWGNGPLFRDTILDDEAPEIKQRLRLPPAHRSFRPQGMTTKDRNSLRIFYGEPLNGTWRLVVRNNGRIAGLLEGWALLVKPASK